MGRGTRNPNGPIGAKLVFLTFFICEIKNPSEFRCGLELGPLSSDQERFF